MNTAKMDPNTKDPQAKIDGRYGSYRVTGYGEFIIYPIGVEGAIPAIFIPAGIATNLLEEAWMACVKMGLAKTQVSRP